MSLQRLIRAALRCPRLASFVQVLANWLKANIYQLLIVNLALSQTAWAPQSRGIARGYGERGLWPKNNAGNCIRR